MMIKLHPVINAARNKYIFKVQDLLKIGLGWKMKCENYGRTILHLVKYSMCQAKAWSENINKTAKQKWFKYKTDNKHWLYLINIHKLNEACQFVKWLVTENLHRCTRICHNNLVISFLTNILFVCIVYILFTWYTPNRWWNDIDVEIKCVPTQTLGWLVERWCQSPQRPSSWDR